MLKQIKTWNTLNEYEFERIIDQTELSYLLKVKKYCDNKYYNTGESSGLDDWKYDKIKDIVNDKSVGCEVTDNKVKLPFWLGSLDKISIHDTVNDSQIKRINTWLRNNTDTNNYIIQHKLDGISCLIHENRLYTRGNGSYGTDITHLKKYIRNIPNHSSIPVRGELIIPKKSFLTFSNEFANARNMLSGIVNSKTIQNEDHIRSIHFIAYSSFSKENQTTITDQLSKVKQVGFDIVTSINIDIHNITLDYLISILVEHKKTSKYEIDGLVIKPDYIYPIITCGNPKHELAIKYRNIKDTVDTEVIKVEWNVSKWGRLKPRVKVKSVSLCGVNIQYATGFNAKYITDNKIGKGAIIRITRIRRCYPPYCIGCTSLREGRTTRR